MLVNYSCFTSKIKERRFYNNFRSNLINRFTKRQNIPSGSERTLGWDTPSRNGTSSAGDLYSNNSFVTFNNM